MVQIKRSRQDIFNASYRSFISHMVQIKPEGEATLKQLKKYFISHMVQIKLTVIGALAQWERALYPTWFR